jgi:hypothetical protein
MNRPGTGRAPLSPARRALERANAHVGLVTRTPGETFTNQWEAEWWNGPKRPVRTYDTEDELIDDLRRLFGPPEGDPDGKKA